MSRAGRLRGEVAERDPGDYQALDPPSFRSWVAAGRTLRTFRCPRLLKASRERCDYIVFEVRETPGGLVVVRRRPHTGNAPVLEYRRWPTPYLPSVCNSERGLLGWEETVMEWAWDPDYECHRCHRWVEGLRRELWAYLTHGATGRGSAHRAR